MNSEEKIQLEIARTMMAARGNNLRDPKVDFDFRSSSNAMKMAKAIIVRFNVDYKDAKEAKIFWPEKETVVEDESKLVEDEGTEGTAPKTSEDSSNTDVTDEPASPRKKKGSKNEEDSQ